MRAALESAGLDDDDLAALLGEPPDTVARWLDGDEEMSGPAFLLALAAVRDMTGISPYWVATGKSDPSFDLRLN